jgi:tight adherence protein C
MDQTTLSILLGICGTVLSTAFLALAIVDRRRALLDARLGQFPESPLKRPRDSRRPANSPPRSWSPEGQQRESERVVVGPAQSNQSFSMIIVRIVGMVLPVLVGAVLAHQGIVQRKTGLFVGAALGLTLFALPVVWMRHRVARQGAEIRHALPDFLDLMIVCLEGGLSIQGALVRVAAELRIAHPRLGAELQTVQRDVELGATIDVAFRNFANRVNLDAVRTLSSFVKEAQRFGSQLVGALRSHAEMMRHQREQAAEEDAQKASVKMLFPTLLLIMPAVFVVLVGPAAIKIQEAFSK